MKNIVLLFAAISNLTFSLASANTVDFDYFNGSVNVEISGKIDEDVGQLVNKLAEMTQLPNGFQKSGSSLGYGIFTSNDVDPTYFFHSQVDDKYIIGFNVTSEGRISLNSGANIIALEGDMAKNLYDVIVAVGGISKAGLSNDTSVSSGTIQCTLFNFNEDRYSCYIPMTNN